MKEKITESGRVKIALTGIILELLILFAPQLGIMPTADHELLKTVAATIAGIIISLIFGRSFRNTPVS